MNTPNKHKTSTAATSGAPEINRNRSKEREGQATGFLTSKPTVTSAVRWMRKSGGETAANCHRNARRVKQAKPWPVLRRDEQRANPSTNRRRKRVTQFTRMKIQPNHITEWIKTIIPWLPDIIKALAFVLLV